MKTKKRTKATRFRGTHTHGRGGKKKARGKGHRGGVGKAGSGKRADHKKNFKINMPGKEKKVRKIIAVKLKTINLRDISDKFRGKKEANLIGYKILSLGDLKEKITIKASAASKSAIDKIKKAGSDITLPAK